MQMTIFGPSANRTCQQSVCNENTPSNIHCSSSTVLFSVRHEVIGIDTKSTGIKAMHLVVRSFPLIENNSFQSPKDSYKILSFQEFSFLPHGLEMFNLQLLEILICECAVFLGVKPSGYPLRN